MSAKSKDLHGRWRSKTVAFRMSEAESHDLDVMVSISGMTKQDYIINKLLNRDIVVKGNPRVFKALKSILAEIHSDLCDIQTAQGDLSDEFMETIQIVSKVLMEMNKED